MIRTCIESLHASCHPQSSVRFVTRTIRVIANPAAGRGRAALALPGIRVALAEHGIDDVRLTLRAGDEARLAREAIADGVDTVIAVGGDGTLSQVGGELTGSQCRLVPIAAGTGNDFAKTLALPARNARAMARLAVAGTDVAIDVGRVDDTLFLNVAGFGFDAAVIADIAGGSLLRGDASYVAAALRQLFVYRGLAVRMPGESNARNRLLLVFANGRHYGGSFRIAPEASLTDGELDVVVIGDASPLRRARLFAAAMRGSHLALPEVESSRGSALTIRFRAPPIYEADGELRRAASTAVEVACLPRALRVISASPAAASSAA